MGRTLVTEQATRLVRDPVYFFPWTHLKPFSIHPSIVYKMDGGGLAVFLQCSLGERQVSSPSQDTQSLLSIIYRGMLMSWHFMYEACVRIKTLQLISRTTHHMQKSMLHEKPHKPFLSTIINYRELNLP
ncbi:hypothetical protein XENOCAPTIV_026806 [Xenoophorus captivus]|uniref:Uncharacterized protein n=1 Tax=Xenoophorus captivus TaxID=1517983 RepID=A0ABV0R3G7_9TELE